MATNYGPFGPQGPKPLKAPETTFHDLIFKYTDDDGEGAYPAFAHKVDNMHPKLCIYRFQMDKLWDEKCAETFPSYRANIEMDEANRGAIYHFALSLKNLEWDNPKCKVAQYWAEKEAKHGKTDLVSYNPAQPAELPHDDDVLLDVPAGLLEPDEVTEWEYDSDETLYSDYDPELDGSNHYTDEEKLALPRMWMEMAEQCANGTFVDPDTTNYETADDEDTSSNEDGDGTESIADWYDRHSEAELNTWTAGYEDEEMQLSEGEEEAENPNPLKRSREKVGDYLREERPRKMTTAMAYHRLTLLPRSRLPDKSTKNEAEDKSLLH